MELRSETRRSVSEYAEVRARLAEFHVCAESEIQAAIRGCLQLDVGLCTQAAACLDSVRAASGDLADARPILLLSGPGAVETLAGCFMDDGGGCGDDPAKEVAVADAGFSRLKGLLRLEDRPELTGRTVRLSRVTDVIAATPESGMAAADSREFVDWAAAGRWLAECSPAELQAIEEAAGGAAAADWELGIQCPDLAKLRVLVAPRLTRWTRARLRQHLPSCALLLHHVDFADAAELERQLREAVEHCVLLLTEQKDILMMHRRLYFVCRVAGGCGDEVMAAQEAAADMVDAALHDFLPDAAERRRRVLFQCDPALSRRLQELLKQQLGECGQVPLRQLLSSLCGLGRAVRGVRGRHLADQASSREQRRSPRQFNGDLERLQTSARAAARSFQRSLEVRLGELSSQIESHLRRQEVKDRLASAFVEFCTSHPHLRRQELEQFLLEQIGLELHNWNRETQVFLRLDRGIWKLKADQFHALRTRAERIPELVTLPSDSFCQPPPSETLAVDDSLSSRTVLSLGIRQIGGQQMKRSFMQSLAVGIGMPLFVPLAAITMAIIWPVTFFRRSGSAGASDTVATPPEGAPRPEKSPVKIRSAKQLHDQAWDFCDKIGRQFINDNFFGVTRHFLQEDARRLEHFVEQYCIVPQDLRARSELLGNPLRLQGQLDDFHKRLQGLTAEAKLYGATRLGYEMLPPEHCLRLGIDCGVSSEAALGERIGGGSFSTVFAPPLAAAPSGPQLALKLIHASATRTALLEAEIMRELAADPHPNLLLCLGSAHFPALGQIGLLMPRCGCNLRQLLKLHRQVLVPAAAAAPEKREQVLAACMRLCQQVLAGVRHLHSKRILHRDLKLENVLADLPDAGCEPADAQLRICDFGFAKEEEMMSGTSFVGTFGYVAPELAPPAPRFTVKSDVYALGVMLWECYYGVSAPKVGTGQIGVLLNGDGGFDLLIRLMTHTMPQERPHIEQCIAMLTLRQRTSELSNVVGYEDSLMMLAGRTGSV